jgi:replicative DNA helicase
MSNLPERIQAATEELRQLRIEIQTSAPPTLAEMDSAALREFKAAIDYVRQLLWNYLQAGSSPGEEELRSVRLERVTEMLHAIQQELKVRQFQPNPATATFLNAVHEIADAALERHSNSGSDIEKAG